MRSTGSRWLMTASRRSLPWDVVHARTSTSLRQALRGPSTPAWRMSGSAGVQ